MNIKYTQKVDSSHELYVVPEKTEKELEEEMRKAKALPKLVTPAWNLKRVEKYEAPVGFANNPIQPVMYSIICFKL